MELKEDSRSNIAELVIEVLDNARVYKSFSIDNMIELMKIDRLEKLTKKFDELDTLIGLEVNKGFGI